MDESFLMRGAETLADLNGDVGAAAAWASRRHFSATVRR